jgi:GTP-binding protein
VDNIDRQYDASEFYSLGFKEYFNVSSISGSGTGELLDAIAERVPEEDQTGLGSRKGLPRIAIIGQPNVGKSSLLNALVGEPRNIVTNIAGTTRDSIHTRYKLFNKDLLLIDTAGIRKKTKDKESIEFYSVIRAIKAIDEADVCVLIIDATLGIELQDLKIFGTVVNKRKGIVIAVNKWDLIEQKHTKTTNEFEKEIKSRISPFTDVPILFVSALTKQRIFRIIEAALEVFRKMQQKIPTSVLNEAVQEAVQKYSPPAVKSKLVKIKYATQLTGRSVAFAFFCSHPKYIKESYRNYLENFLREKFDFKGVPITLVFKDK